MKRLGGCGRREDHHHREQHQFPLDEPEIQRQDEPDESSRDQRPEQLPHEHEKDLRPGFGSPRQAGLGKAERTGEEQDHHHVGHKHEAQCRLGENTPGPGLREERQGHHRRVHRQHHCEEQGHEEERYRLEALQEGEPPLDQ
jgi:hypothetical protein